MQKNLIIMFSKLACFNFYTYIYSNNKNLNIISYLNHTYRVLMKLKIKCYPVTFFAKINLYEYSNHWIGD